MRGLLLIAVMLLVTGCGDSPADLASKVCQVGRQYAADEIALETLLGKGEAIGQRAKAADISRADLDEAMERECGGLDEAIRVTLLRGQQGPTAESLAAEVCLRWRRYQDGDAKAAAYLEARRDAGARAQLADIPIVDLQQAITSHCAAVEAAEASGSDKTEGSPEQSKDEAVRAPSNDRAKEGSTTARARLHACPPIEPEGDFRIDAVGVYEGAGTASVELEDSSNPAGRVDVIVNRPDKPVVLVLSAYQPVVWELATTSETELAGVIVSGYHTQRVRGINAATPLRATSHKGPGHCDEPFQAYEEGADFQKANQVVANLLGREIDTFNGAYRAERFVVGKATKDVAAVREGESQRSSSSAAPKSVKAGEPGIKQLRRSGALRPARAPELERWAQLARQAQDLSKRALPVPENKRFQPIYTVTRAMRYPKGLHGAHSQRFLIPEGVPEPLGDPGHSTVYDMNTASCRGTGCPRVGR